MQSLFWVVIAAAQFWRYLIPQATIGRKKPLNYGLRLLSSYSSPLMASLPVVAKPCHRFSGWLPLCFLLNKLDVTMPGTLKEEEKKVYAAALYSLSLPFCMDLLGPTSILVRNSGAMDFNSYVQMLSSDARQNMVAILDVTMPEPTTGT